MRDPSGLEPGGQDETMTDQRRISTDRASDGVGENAADLRVADRECTLDVHPAGFLRSIDIARERLRRAGVTVDLKRALASLDDEAPDA